MREPTDEYEAGITDGERDVARGVINETFCPLKAEIGLGYTEGVACGFLRRRGMAPPPGRGAAWEMWCEIKEAERAGTMPSVWKTTPKREEPEDGVREDVPEDAHPAPAVRDQADQED